jgi:hypothetical protein
VPCDHDLLIYFCRQPPAVACKNKLNLNYKAVKITFFDFS